jgi:glycosyltransferase involved in cell wall biosynthesis
VEFNVVADFLTPGSVPNVEQYYAAFDVFLNTSVFEGLSISLLEAINSGCPIVTADVGGNREVLPDRAILVRDPSNIGSYVSGIVEALRSRFRALALKPADFDLVPRLWTLLGRYGQQTAARSIATRNGTLFLTDNLNIGGAQKSLINLLCHLPRPRNAWLAVLDPIYGEGYLDRLTAAEVPVLSLCDTGDYLGRLERILAMIEQLDVRNVCFWNVDPRIKLLLAKILPSESVRLLDVSPGPFLFEEMKRTAEFQRRIAFGEKEYWARLDCFVAKYKGGCPPAEACESRKVAMIPNGVPLPASAERQLSLLPKGCDPDLVIGTACRIMPTKRLDFLIDVMAELNRRLSGVQLIVVGGVDPRHADYWPVLMQRLREKQITNIHFAGPHADVGAYLNLFKVFVMLSEGSGCPNASLEAMARGIPVVANTDGGVGEQILSGINGFLVEGRDPREMARQIRYLLVNQEARRRFGEAARITATKDFSMDTMVRRYKRLLEDPAPRAQPVNNPARKRSHRHKASAAT